MPRPLLIALLLPALAAAGCGKSSTTTAKTTSTPPATTQAAAPTAEGCEAAQPKVKGAQHLRKPRAKLDPKKTYVLELITSCGEIDITLDVKRAPKTAASV